MTKCTRRQFLEDSVLAAAVAAAFPTRGLWAAEATSGVPKKNPGELLQVAILGVGTRGGVHIDEFTRNPNTEVAYIVDADENAGQRGAEVVARKQGRRPKVVQDMRAAFDDKSVEHRLGRHAQPLALAGGDLGHAGRQGRLRGEAGEPQPERRPPHRGDRPQAQPHLPGRHAMPLDAGHRSTPSSMSSPARSARSSWPAACATSSAVRLVRRATTKCRTGSTTISGAVRRGCCR